ncbi:MAG TPA: TonB-dependent receptor plug domain-containing protein [Gemmatimonadaceae bacterium]|nr:TonB-dependent receptor plug domain-containing protein [Gemmatimonadaceae bacterium]
MALALSRALAAQPHVCSAQTADSASSGNAEWSPPLDRAITVRGANLSLRDALDRVATAARIRLSYSAEQVPLDRAVCVSADASPAGRVLADLLSGTNVAAVVVGADQVVLSPRMRPARADGPGMAPTLGVLDRVVVTGTAGGGTPAKELAVGLDVLNGRTLARDNTNTISDALDSYVPGVWSWAQSPSNMLSSYASIRGASSFGLSYPKIYIDGIEVANPLLLSRFAPGAIDHIEVIRGPQGAALYGADAISGVVNIVTRHDGGDGDGAHAAIRSTVGTSQSSYARGVMAQDHALSLVTGTSTRSMDLNVSGSTMGSFVPNGYSRDLMASGGGRIVGNTGSITTTARLFFEQAGVPSSPLVQTPMSSSPGGPPATTTRNGSPQTVTEYTIGATALHMPGQAWVDSFVVGVDGYRLSNVQTNYTPVPSIVDSALRAAQGGADRATLRASRVFRFRADDPTRGSLTLSAEHATLRASTLTSSAFVYGNRGPGSSGGPGGQDSRQDVLTPLVTWQNSTGVTAQANAAINNTLFFTSGVRLEEDSRLAPGDRFVTLPMFGIADVNDVGPFTMKLRAAYGRGIRPPSTMQRWQMWQPQTAEQAALGPEVQSGTEVGVDLMLHQALTVQLTRFDQRASGLIQQVPFASDSALTGRRMQYIAQNVGEISNSGWELGATSTLSRVTMNASFAAVDSRVRKLAPGYTGDLETGDRMLQVPAITAGFGATWTGDAWTASLGGTRAFNWINYDEVALAQTWLSGTESVHQMVGPELRNFWRRYTGGLHLRASISHDFRRDFSVEVTGDNLLNYQSGEPDNITIIPGRTIMSGVRIKF